ncbi:hypothetical protein SBADM41S_03826 [Streptomyces badius]
MRLESGARQPGLGDGGRAGRHDVLGPGVGDDQVLQPAFRALAEPVRHLVDPVHQDQRPALLHHPVRPPRRGRAVQRDAGRAQEIRRGGQRVEGREGAQPQHEGDAPVPVRQLVPERLAGRVQSQPLHQRALAGTGRAAQQEPVPVTEGLLDPDRGPDRVVQTEPVGGLVRPTDLQTDVRRLQRPPARRPPQRQPEQLHPVVGVRDELRVPPLELQVRRVRARPHPVPYLRDQLPRPPRRPDLLHRRPRRERRVRGQLLHQMRAAAAEEVLVQIESPLRQPGGRGRKLRPQPLRVQLQGEQPVGVQDAGCQRVLYGGERGQPFVLGQVRVRLRHAAREHLRQAVRLRRAGEWTDRVRHQARARLRGQQCLGRRTGHRGGQPQQGNLRTGHVRSSPSATRIPQIL